MGVFFHSPFFSVGLPFSPEISSSYFLLSRSLSKASRKLLSPQYKDRTFSLPFSSDRPPRSYEQAPPDVTNSCAGLMLTHPMSPVDPILKTEFAFVSRLPSLFLVRRPIPLQFHLFFPMVIVSLKDWGGFCPKSFFSLLPRQNL